MLEFLRRNGFPEAELALKEDISERKGLLGSYDSEKFRFPMSPPLPPVKVPVTSSRLRDFVPGLGSGSGSDPDSSGDEEFKSLGSSSSVSGSCSSDFMNPYGRSSVTQAGSDTSSERLSQFGTARDYHEFDMKTDLWYDDKDDGPYMTPCFGGMDPLGCPSEDKFIMTLETGSLSRNPFSFNHLSDASEENNGCMEYLFLSHRTSTESDNVDDGLVKRCCHLNEKIYPEEGVKWDHGHVDYNYNGEDADSSLKDDILKELESKIARQSLSDADPVVNEGNGKGPAEEFHGSRSSDEDVKHDWLLDDNYNYCYEIGDDKDVNKSSQDPSTSMDGQELESTTPAETPYWETNEDEYEIFNLRIIHRKNRTGFEENKDFPILLNTMVAGRYYITEYLGSAAFSKVVQAHDIQTGVDVCLKIIKNDKDFFDQSLDEIKLLKYVNKHDPADARHILRLYDYFYCQEHLFIVCELLRANLYEFQKYNLETGAEPYFTMSRLQAIARQCLEALDYLHSLGIIHCDLKPENVLIKSYSRCEIKVIDLGSSCFETDNMCLYVQSRSYRAPEVILGLPYGPKIDIWSLGCIMAELCSGEVLFPNNAVVTLLARMIGLIGPIDLEMLLRGQETHKYFTKEYDLYYITEETNQMEYIIPEKSSLEHQLPVSDPEFMDFLRYLLQINPERRPTAREALQHPWLSFQY